MTSSDEIKFKHVIDNIYGYYLNILYNDVILFKIYVEVEFEVFDDFYYYKYLSFNNYMFKTYNIALVYTYYTAPFIIFENKTFQIIQNYKTIDKEFLKMIRKYKLKELNVQF